jgi:nucleoid DNA-binding protein
VDKIISISRAALRRYVNKKIKRAVHTYHVLGIINILFDEMLKDLKDGKEIKIFNLGVLSLKPTKPRRYYNVVFKKTMMSNGKKILRFKMARNLHKKIITHLDTE